MTRTQLMQAALNRFAANGFDGTSMAHIAEDVGIKKQSIYTYFKGKDELFLQVCSDVMESELNAVAQFIAQNKEQPVEEFLYEFLLFHKKRYEENADTKFWLRISFFPPAHLYDAVMEKVYDYLEKLEEMLKLVMEKAKVAGELSEEINAGQATTALLGVLDGVFVEMLYGGPDRTIKRLEASWLFFWRGVMKNRIT